MSSTIVLGSRRHASALISAGLNPATVVHVEPLGARVHRSRTGIRVTNAGGATLTATHLVLAGDLALALTTLEAPTVHERKLLGALAPDGAYPSIDETWTFEEQLAAIAGERHTWHLPGEPTHHACADVVRAIEGTHPRLPPRRRVAVLGGGPAGLAIAHLLEQENIATTVYERSERLGGKCLSVPVDGVLHDVGGCFTTPDYHVFREWLQRRGMGVTSVSGRNYLEKGGSFSKMYDGIVAQSSFPAVSIASVKYLTAWYRRERGIHRMDAGKLSDAERAELVAELASPALAWFEAHDLRPIIPIFEFVMTALGYDWFDQVPMLYVHRWVGPEKMLAVAAEGHLTHELREGFQRFWEAVAHPLWDVRMGQVITAVDRDPAGVVVHASSGVERFDAVVVACPLPAVPFGTRSSGEERIVQHTKTMDYVSFLARIKGLPPGTYTIPERIQPEWAGHFYCIRTTSDDKLRTEADKQVFVGYAYAKPGMTEAELAENLRQDLPEFGCELEELITLQRWSFFPHFDAAGVQAGLPWELEGLQGHLRTWYTGSIASFESCDNVIDHGVRLAPRIVEALR